MSGQPGGQGAAPVHWGESLVEWVTATALVGAGMVSGFTHIAHNATGHKVTPWLAWAIAVTIELTALYAVVKLRRRLAEQRPVWTIVALLTAGLALSMASQLAKAEHSVWGWVYNGWPVVGGLWVAKLTLSDLAHRAGVTQVQADHAEEVKGLTARVHELVQQVAHEQSMNQAMSRDLDQSRAEVKRLTDQLMGARREPSPSPSPAPPKRPVGKPPVEETALEKAVRVAEELAAKNGRKPTYKQIAEAAGVSVSTVKRALGESADEPSLRLVEGAG